MSDETDFYETLRNAGCSEEIIALVREFARHERELWEAARRAKDTVRKRLNRAKLKATRGFARLKKRVQDLENARGAVRDHGQNVQDHVVRHRHTGINDAGVPGPVQDHSVPGGTIFFSETRLLEAAAANAALETSSDLNPIVALIQEGCDLELDVLPTIAATVPQLPRPLRSWGAPWLRAEIRAARDRRLSATMLAVVA
jgi:hypothetical protein